MCKPISTFVLTLSASFTFVVLALALTSFQNLIEDATGNVAAGNAIYGTPWGADSLYNLDVGGTENQRISFRFRAQNDGALQSIRVYWTDNAERSGYARGNGGQIRIEIFANSGAPKNEPTGPALASMLYKPNYVNGVDPLGIVGVWGLLSFPSPAPLKRGQLYHVTFTNVDSAPVNNYTGLDTWIVFSDESQPATSTLEFGILYNSGTGWKDASHNYASQKPNAMTPVISLYYADGKSQGNGYVEIWLQQLRSISGSQMVRQTFKPSGTITELNNVSVRLRKVNSLGPLLIRIENEAGKVLAQASVPTSTVNGSKHHWVSGVFDHPFDLQAGQTYHLVFTSPKGKYEAYCLGDGGRFGFGMGSVFADGYAEFNRGDGTGWQVWYGWSDNGNPIDKHGDIQFYLSQRKPVKAYLPSLIR